MNRRNTASGVIVAACVLTISTTLATVLLTIMSAEYKHYFALVLGIFLTVIWGLISLFLGTTAIMSLRDEIEYETLADSESHSVNSTDNV